VKITITKKVIPLAEWSRCSPIHSFIFTTINIAHCSVTYSANNRSVAIVPGYAKEGNELHICSTIRRKAKGDEREVVILAVSVARIGVESIPTAPKSLTSSVLILVSWMSFSLNYPVQLKTYILEIDMQNCLSADISILQYVLLCCCKQRRHLPFPKVGGPQISSSYRKSANLLTNIC
jgi:hypothetical protein